MRRDILLELSEHARKRVEAKKEQIPAETMKQLALACAKDESFPFEASLRKPQMTFICECKKASPSKGLIAPEFPYLKIAEDYVQGGADVISVLTEPKWFLGSDQYLQEIAALVPIPVLRKDFIVDPYLIYEAKVLGASVILLIAAILSEEELREYRQLAESLGMSALVETHDETEIDTALRSGAFVIGVNNRNLHDFKVDLSNSIRLRKSVPDHVLMVAESGIQTRGDIEVLEAGGVNGVLIGETLMRAPDRVRLLRELKGETV